MNKTKAKKPAPTTIEKYQKKLIMTNDNLMADSRQQVRLVKLGQVEDIKICRRLRVSRARCLTYIKQLEILAKTDFSPKQLKLITNRIDKFLDKIK